MWLIWLILGLIWGLFSIPVLLIKFVVQQLTLRVSRTPELHVRGDSDQIEQEIMRLIPIGTPVAQAKKIMARNDFTCQYKDHATFVRSRGVSSDIVLRDADILLCRRTRPGCLIPIWPYGWVAQDWICAFE